MNPASTVTEGPLLLAIPIAMLAGLISFLSPCCLPLVPGYLAYVTGSAGSDVSASPTTPARLDTTSQRHALTTRTRISTRISPTLLGTILFVLGFAAVFTSYGALFGELGAVLVRYNATITKALGALTIVLGMAYAGLLARVPFFAWTFRPRYQAKAGLVGAPVLGVLFGVGWTPCIGPTLATVLTLAATSTGAARGAVLSFAYSLGLGIPFLLAAMGVSRAFHVFGWARRHAPVIMRVGGGMLIAVGVLEVTGVWALLVAQLQGLVANWQSPL